jgi:hypothetical protein
MAMKSFTLLNLGGRGGAPGAPPRARAHRHPVHQRQQMHGLPIQIVHLIRLGHALFLDEHRPPQRKAGGQIVGHPHLHRHAKYSRRIRA